MSGQSRAEECVLRIWQGHPFEGGKHRGSGFAVDRRHVVTCYHVIDPHDKSVDDPGLLASQLHVDGAGLPAALAVDRVWAIEPAKDRETDLAILRLRAPPLMRADLPRPIAAADSCLDVGVPVELVGYGDVRESVRSVMAVVRSYYPQLGSYIVTAMVPKGMSGGPALHRGRVVGVTKARETDAGEVDLIHCSLVHELMGRAGAIFDAPTESSRVRLEDLPRLSEEARVRFVREFPMGPPIDPIVLAPNVSDAFADGHDASTSKATLLQANRLRTLADPQVPKRGITLDFPDPYMSHPRDFWTSVLVEACQRGPRMLAALVASSPPTVIYGAKDDLERILGEYANSQ